MLPINKHLIATHWLGGEERIYLFDAVIKLEDPWFATMLACELGSEELVVPDQDESTQRRREMILKRAGEVLVQGKGARCYHNAGKIWSRFES